MKLKRVLFAFSLTVFLFFGWQVYQFVIYDFSLENISHHFPEKAQVNIEAVDVLSLQKVFDQSYRYLDQGTQSYVFLSQDEKYVIKFFKFRHLKSSWFDYFCPKKIKSKYKKLQRLFFGFQLAYEKDRENNALVYLHLNPTNFLKKSLEVKDRYGFSHQIDLDEVMFVVQEKGKATKQIISELLNHNDVAGAKQCFRQILDLYICEYQKGLWDRDHNVMYNTGFVGGKAVRIDVGRLRADDRYKAVESMKLDLEKIVYKRIPGWMSRHYPQFQQEIVTDVQKKLNEIFAESQG